jgi:hypothetical protein
MQTSSKEEAYYKNSASVCRIKNGIIHRFVLSASETAWIHRNVMEFDLFGMEPCEKQDYIEFIGRFTEKLKIFNN